MINSFLELALLLASFTASYIAGVWVGARAERRRRLSSFNRLLS